MSDGVRSGASGGTSGGAGNGASSGAMSDGASSSSTSRSAIARLAVYCGSATPPDPRYIALARKTGTQLAMRGIGIVYGGGRLGLMGALAEGALAQGGEVIGVIPEALARSEVVHSDCTRILTVAGMHERKQQFADLADGFVALPGGVGTMEELFEALSWAQIGYHHKPVGLLNAFGFYDHLIAFSQHMADVGFVRQEHHNILIIEEHIAELLDKLGEYRPHTPIFAMDVRNL